MAYSSGRTARCVPPDAVGSARLARHPRDPGPLPPMPPTSSTTLLSAEEAKERLREIVEGFFFRRLTTEDGDRIRRLLVKSPPGLGKASDRMGYPLSGRQGRPPPCSGPARRYGRCGCGRAQSIEAPLAAAGDPEIEEDEAVDDRQLPAVEQREATSRRMRHEVGDAMLPARTKATVRVNKPSASSKPPTNSNKPWRPGTKVNRT